MTKLLRQATLTLLVLTVLTGLVYPLAVTGIAGLCCSRHANGSLIRRGDRLVGSELIGQPFDGAAIFLAAAIGHIATALRRPQLGWFESRPDQLRAIRRRPGAHRAAARGRSGQHAADSGGPGHRIGQRPGSRNQSGGGGISIAASGRRARTGPGARAPADPAPHPPAPVGNIRRARRQRAGR